jgi:hypothetical protein
MSNWSKGSLAMSLCVCPNAKPPGVAHQCERSTLGVSQLLKVSPKDILPWLVTGASFPASIQTEVPGRLEALSTPSLSVLLFALDA